MSQKGPLFVQGLDKRVGELDWDALALRTHPAGGFCCSDALIPEHVIEIAADIDRRKVR